MVGPNLPFGGLACGLVLGPLPSSRLGGLCTVLSPGVDQKSKSTCGRTPREIQGRKSTDWPPEASPG